MMARFDAYAWGPRATISRGRDQQTNLEVRVLSRWMQAGLLLTLLALLAGGLWLHRVQAEAMRFEVER